MTRQKKIAVFVGGLTVVLIGVLIGIIIFLLRSTNRLTTYRMDTQVANVHVGGLYVNQAREQITKEALKWRDEADIQLIYQLDYRIPIDNMVFSFDVNGTIQKIRDGETIPIDVSFQPQYQDYLAKLIEEHAHILKYSDFDLQQLENDLLHQVGMLKSPIWIELGHYVLNLDINKKEIATTTLYGIDDKIFPLIEEYFDGRIEMTIQPNAYFHLTDVMKELAKERLTGEKASIFNDEQLSVLGTGIYELILYTNFMNIQRSITEDPFAVPNYIYNRPGFEVRIDTNKGIDFSFYNPNATPYTVIITQSGAGLKFILTGAPFIHTIEVIGADDVQLIDYPTITIERTEYLGKEIKPGQPIRINGKEGKVVKISRKITSFNTDGSVKEVKVLVMNEDHYRPRPQLIIYHPDDRNMLNV